MANLGDTTLEFTAALVERGRPLMDAPRDVRGALAEHIGTVADNLGFVVQHMTDGERPTTRAIVVDDAFLKLIALLNERRLLGDADRIVLSRTLDKVRYHRNTRYVVAGETPLLLLDPDRGGSRCDEAVDQIRRLRRSVQVEREREAAEPIRAQLSRMEIAAKKLTAIAGALVPREKIERMAS